MRNPASPQLFIKLGRPVQKESKGSDPKAIELLQEIQRDVRFIHVPSFRDAASARFNRTLSSALRV